MGDFVPGMLAKQWDGRPHTAKGRAAAVRRALDPPRAEGRPCHEDGHHGRRPRALGLSDQLDKAIEETLAPALKGARALGQEDDLWATVEAGAQGAGASATAVRLAAYKDFFHSGRPPAGPVCQLPVDTVSASNSGLMADAAGEFLRDQGLVDYGIEFPRALTMAVVAAEADHLTEHGLWDLKVKSSPMTARDTLQLLTYWRMGLRSRPEGFSRVDTLGIVNPRQGVAWTFPTSEIGADVVRAVEHDVLGGYEPED